MIGGLLTSTLFTLLVLPTLFLVVTRTRESRGPDVVA
jgi:Cu/Ag efflux pump CusA